MKTAIAVPEGMLVYISNETMLQVADAIETAAFAVSFI
jgi:hypothetical protein